MFFFGLMRVLNDNLTDSSTSYFPYTNGLGYWNETMPTMHSVNIDTMNNNNRLAAWCLDVNHNDSLGPFKGYGGYYCSLTSMPTATIDNNNTILLFYTMLMDNLDDGTKNYRHIWERRSTMVAPAGMIP